MPIELMKTLRRAALDARLRGRYWLLARRPDWYWQARKLVRGEAEPECRLLDRWCRPDALALDVGANLGAWTHEIAPRVRHVHAFEPIPELVRILERGLAGRNVSVHRAAASTSAGSARIRVPRMASALGTIEAENGLVDGVREGAEVESYEVPTLRIDDLSLVDVCFIKVDVEGHEMGVLEGAIETIRRERPTLVVESEARHRATAPRELMALMCGLGYRAYKLVDGRLVELAPGSDPEAVPGRNFVFEPDARPG